MAVQRMMCRWSCMGIPASGELLPKGGFARREERVFAGVPAEEMRGFSVKAMMFSSGPDFMKKERSGDFEGAVQIVGEAAFFTTGGGDEGAKFGFEEEFLAFLGSLAVAPLRALRRVAGRFALRFAMVAGIVLQA